MVSLGHFAAPIILGKIDVSRGPFYLDGLTYIPGWMLYHMPCKVFYEITYPFPNFNCVEVPYYFRIQ